MITKPDLVAKTAPGRRFDRMASALIGCIALLAAVLAIVQAGQSQIGGRAQLMASRLADDVLTRGSASQLAADFSVGSALQAIALRVDGTSRQQAGDTFGDAGARAVGVADQRASDALQAALTDTASTSGGPPLDGYAAGLVRATIVDMANEVTEQRHQVDIASDAGSRSRLAVLGLSLAALAGVMVGLALALREGRPGWAALLAASSIGAMAVLVALAAII